MAHGSKQKSTRNNILKVLAIVIPIILAIIICLQSSIGAALNPDLIGEILEFLTGSEELAGTSKLSTPTSETIMSEATSTQTPLIPSSAPTLLPGQDWASNCIDGNIWHVYLAGEHRTDQPSCYQLTEWGIKAEQGRLSFVYNHSQPTAYEYGILAPWHDWTEVDFTVEARRLENSEVWFGLFEGDTPNSTGIVFVIKPGDVIDIREMPSENPVVNNVYLNFAGGKFHPRIIFDEGKIAVWVDGQGIISQWPIDFSIRNMFFGYRALPNTIILASVFDLKFRSSLVISASITPTEALRNETDTPNPTQIVQNLFDEIDSQLRESSMKSNIAFNYPKSMKEEESAIVELLLNPSLSQSELATRVVENGGFITSTVPPGELLPSSNGGFVTSTPLIGELVQPEGGSVVDIMTSEIEITPRMKAVLISQDPKDFTIQELHDGAEQVVGSNNSTTWKWSITAEEEGRKTLTLILYRLVKYDGKEYWPEVEAYKAVIAVEVTPLQQVKSFDWKWFTGIAVTIALSLFGYFINKNKEKINKSKPYKNSVRKK